MSAWTKDCYKASSSEKGCYFIDLNITPEASGADYITVTDFRGKEFTMRRLFSFPTYPREWRSEHDPPKFDKRHEFQFNQITNRIWISRQFFFQNFPGKLTGRSIRVQWCIKLIPLLVKKTEGSLTKLGGRVEAPLRPRAGRLLLTVA